MFTALITAGGLAEVVAALAVALTYIGIPALVAVAVVTLLDGSDLDPALVPGPTRYACRPPRLVDLREE
jgi:hypothetical protein